MSRKPSKNVILIMLPAEVLEDIARHAQQILELATSPKRIVGETLPDDVKARLGIPKRAKKP